MTTYLPCPFCTSPHNAADPCAWELDADTIRVGVTRSNRVSMSGPLGSTLTPDEARDLAARLTNAATMADYYAARDLEA